MVFSIIPNSLKQFILNLLNSRIKKTIDSEYLLSRLYVTGNPDDLNEMTVEKGNPYKTYSIGEDQGLPIPPLGHLTMYYGHNVDDYLGSGRNTASMIKSILEKYDLTLGENTSMMEWGCTTGRVLRHFSEEAKKAEIWGVDIDLKSMNWAKANLSPPFNFLGISTYPHLPFEDHKFSVIYGISVMTHLIHFRDMWLMELKRILKPDGLLILTIHDEYTLERLLDLNKKNQLNTQSTFYNYLVNELNPNEIMKHDFVQIKGVKWFTSYTLFKTEYIQREWGKYLDILEIQTYAEGGLQSAVVMRQKKGKS